MFNAFLLRKLVFQVFTVLILLSNCDIKAQHLKRGFSKAEYIDLLKVSAKHGDSIYFNAIGDPENYQFKYRSPVVGLDNLWDLWISPDSIAVISIRGTTTNSVSWLANFYAAMIPAQGTLYLSQADSFHYKLAEHPNAAVHAGWVVSTAFLAKDIMPKLDSCYKSGIKDFIILGHSQGGAIAYLMTSYLLYLKKDGTLPQDIWFKTYCSAGPKPGNLYYAYDYESITYPGWAFNVVNAADWVPETPVSIQTINDFNKTNPFVSAKAMIKKQKFPNNLLFRYVYNRLDKPTRRAQRNYQKYLGKMTSKLVQKHLPEFKSPAYYTSNDYVRVGNMIVLMGDAEYFKLYPDDSKQPFVHHFHPPYLYLVNKLPD